MNAANGTRDISAAVTLTAQTNIILQPVSVTQKAGKAAKFSISASGSSLTYQWQYNDGSGWKNCTWTGSRTTVLSVPAAAGRNGYKFRCIVKSANAAKTVSGTATLTVKLAQPETQRMAGCGTGSCAPESSRIRFCRSTGSSPHRELPVFSERFAGVLLPLRRETALHTE